MAIFAKYDGIDGQSLDSQHDKWIDVLSIDWGMNRPGGGTTGQARQKSTANMQDVNIVMDYEKAAPKLQENACLGKVIPSLKIDLTTTYDGAKSVYLTYELKNVMVTSFQTNASGMDGAPPTVSVSNNFEEIKVTYTEYSPEGDKGGNVETTYNVPKGTK